MCELRWAISKVLSIIYAVSFLVVSVKHAIVLTSSHLLSPLVRSMFLVVFAVVRVAASAKTLAGLRFWVPEW